MRRIAQGQMQGLLAAENHFGYLSSYLAAGFTARRTDSDGSVWVGRELQAALRHIAP
jgi:hypothetical protein